MPPTFLWQDPTPVNDIGLHGTEQAKCHSMETLHHQGRTWFLELKNPPLWHYQRWHYLQHFPPSLKEHSKSTYQRCMQPRHSERLLLFSSDNEDVQKLGHVVEYVFHLWLQGNLWEMERALDWLQSHQQEGSSQLAAWCMLNTLALIQKHPEANGIHYI